MGRRVALFGLMAWLALAIACGSAVPLGGAGSTGAEADASSASSASDDRPGFSTAGWKTDFSKHTVPFREITSGGPPKDGIPPVDQPKFLEASGKIDWLKDNEPVVALTIGGQAKAYPLQILIWHEIVNDTLGGIPVTVTFCPLCNTAIAFDRRLGGTAYDFGTSGNLRYSDLVMYDRQTESWWQQITGEAIVGELTGTRLKMLPATIISYKDFRTAYPQGRVLTRDTGHARPYGSNPYTGYDDINASPFLFRGPSDGRLPPMERVVAVSINGQDIAYPFRLLQERKVVHHQVGDVHLVVLWAPGTASALDQASIAASRDIGATALFKATTEDKTLTFEPLPQGSFRDKETGTEWNLAGQGIRGALAGKTLEPIVHANHFWFAWAVFKPQTKIFQIEG